MSIIDDLKFRFRAGAQPSNEDFALLIDYSTKGELTYEALIDIINPYKNEFKAYLEIQPSNPFINRASINYTVPINDLASGTISAGSEITITDEPKNWIPNAFVDKVVEYTAIDQSIRYALIVSNTNNTLTFDDNLEVQPLIFGQYRILNTIQASEVNTNPMGAIYAFDTTSNTGAIVLPLVATTNLRKEIRIYIERGNGNKLVIIAKTTNRIRTQKYVTLDAELESALFMSHNWITNHFDVVSEANIQRYIFGYYADNQNIVRDPSVVIKAGVFDIDLKKRFNPVIIGDDDIFLQYESTLERLFTLKANLIITKGGACEAYFAKYDAVSDLIIPLDSRKANTLFSAGTDAEMITVETPVFLKKGDRVTLYARNTAGETAITAGSQISIT